jgi:hypothetical protein
MEKKNKKLQLNKETLRNLSDESLAQAAGGGRKNETAIGACDNTHAHSACILITACKSACIGQC